MQNVLLDVKTKKKNQANLEEEQNIQPRTITNKNNVQCTFRCKTKSKIQLI